MRSFDGRGDVRALWHGLAKAGTGAKGQGGGEGEDQTHVVLLNQPPRRGKADLDLAKRSGDLAHQAESFFEIKPLFAPELVTGFGLLEGRPVGIVANNPAVVGGVLFVDSADKAARFIWLCDAFSIPLVFLADVPGFMIGTAVERQGIIRHGAKMITAVSEATVPKISVILRKAYGAGLYAMAGPAFDPVATLALPTAKIAVMGPEAAVNAVFANKITEIEDPDEQAAFVAERRSEYEADVDLLRLASELVVDAVIVLTAFRVTDAWHVALSVLGAVVLNMTLAINHRPGRYMAV